MTWEEIARHCASADSPSATAPHGPPSWPCGRPGDGGVRAAMSIELNHTIVRCRDHERSTGFLADILGRPAPSAFGPFLVVELDNGVSLDFYAVEGEVAAQHYAFLIGEEDFDAVFARLQARGLQHWADRSEEHTSELQSLMRISYAVFCLKKKKNI